jgi:NADP-dependent 3-hydroxy acid dehydrogenase YdfG
MPTPASPSLFDLTGRVIIVTGATGVLAGSAARYLVAQGARVVFLGRDQTKLDAARADCAGLSGEAATYSVDVLDRAGLETVRADIVARFGRIDALITAARHSLETELQLHDIEMHKLLLSSRACDGNSSRHDATLSQMESILSSTRRDIQHLASTLKTERLIKHNLQ